MEPKCDLRRKNFIITPGCRIIDDEISYRIQHVYFSGIPTRYHLVVSIT